jgi:opacity protein-like surface antigen
MKKVILTALLTSTVMSSFSCVAADEKKYFIQFNTGYAHGASSSGDFSQGNMGNTSLFGIEAGYKLNENFRMSASFDYLPSFSNNSTLTNSIERTANIKVKSYVSMLNLYYDIGQFSGFTPYATIGAGIARNKTGLYTTDITGTGYTAVDASNTTNNFAYKLGLGTKYSISNDFDLDLRYQYSDLGKFSTGAMESSYNNGVFVDSGNSAKQTGKLSAHQILVGVSYKF